MKLESKYDLNQTVWNIHKSRNREIVSCPACLGIGRITLADEESHLCPKCRGNMLFTNWTDEAWNVEQELTIGKITVEAENIGSDGMFGNIGHYREGITETETVVRYMAYETGIGSGQNYYEDALFESKELAQKECNRLNEVSE